MLNINFRKRYLDELMCRRRKRLTLGHSDMHITFSRFSVKKWACFKIQGKDSEFCVACNSFAVALIHICYGAFTWLMSSFYRTDRDLKQTLKNTNKLSLKQSNTFRNATDRISTKRSIQRNNLYIHI